LIITGVGIPLGFEIRVLLSFGLTVLLAAVSYRWLEQPFLRMKNVSVLFARVKCASRKNAFPALPSLCPARAEIVLHF
jgi:peptidoglycan/LPS O-acetylase OafA/YrhL